MTGSHWTLRGVNIVAHSEIGPRNRPIQAFYVEGRRAGTTTREVWQAIKSLGFNAPRNDIASFCAEVKASPNGGTIYLPRKRAFCPEVREP